MQLFAHFAVRAMPTPKSLRCSPFPIRQWLQSGVASLLCQVTKAAEGIRNRLAFLHSCRHITRNDTRRADSRRPTGIAMSHLHPVVVVFTCFLGLTACSGGGGSGTPPPSPPPVITTQPTALTVNAGSAATFTV